MKALTLSDIIVPHIYSPQARIRFADADLIIGCGDLAYYYLEYVFNALDVPLFFVRGNHDKVVEYSSAGQRTAPAGGIDLHGRTYRWNNLLFAGVEGSIRYKPGQYQYTQGEMWGYVLRLAPSLMWNKLRYGRFLDVFVTHAPAQGIHDMPDRTHQGIRAFRWLLHVFQPAYHFHGHIHIYRPDTIYHTRIGGTRVINTFGFRETVLDR